MVSSANSPAGLAADCGWMTGLTGHRDARSDIEEDETETVLTKELECNNVTSD